jgi:hypothetical protein
MISSSSIFAKLSKKVYPSGETQKYKTDRVQTTRNQRTLGMFNVIELVPNSSRQSITVAPMNDVEIRLGSIGSGYYSPIKVQTMKSNEDDETPEKLDFNKSPIFGYKLTPKIESYRSKIAKQNAPQFTVPNKSVSDSLRNVGNNKVTFAFNFID